MSTNPAPRSSGNSFLFYCALLIVVLLVAAGLYYLIPGLYHPFTSDTSASTHAHLIPAFGLFVAALVFLILARFVRPAT